MNAKIRHLLLVTVVISTLVTFAGCKKKEEPEPETNNNTPYIQILNEDKEMFKRNICYIVNKENGHYMVVGPEGKDPNDTWTPLKGSNPNLVYQHPMEMPTEVCEWLLMAAESDYYWIINKVSGEGLYADNDRRVLQDSFKEEEREADRFLWKIVKSGKERYVITNKGSDNYLAAGAGGLDPNDRAVWHWPIEEEDPSGIIWYIKPAGDLPFDLRTEPGTTPNDIGDVDRIRGFGHVPKEETDPVVIGEVLMPFFFVGENQSLQIKKDPYYKFKREGFWRRVFYYEHDGKTEKTEERDTKTGLVQTSSETIEDKTDITVTAHASFSYSGLVAKFKASVSTSFSKELKVTTSTSETVMEEETTIIKTMYPIGERFVHVVWLRVDRYTLSRLSGTPIVKFETINPDERIEDSYPRTD